MMIHDAKEDRKSSIKALTYQSHVTFDVVTTDINATVWHTFISCYHFEGSGFTSSV